MENHALRNHLKFPRRRCSSLFPDSLSCRSLVLSLSRSLSLSLVLSFSLVLAFARSGYLAAPVLIYADVVVEHTLRTTLPGTDTVTFKYTFGTVIPKLALVSDEKATMCKRMLYSDNVGTMTAIFVDALFPLKVMLLFMPLGQCCLKSGSLPFQPRICSRTLMDGFIPPLRRGGWGSPPATSRRGSLLLSLSADVRSSD